MGDEQKLKVDHVERPRLPWRDALLTECGLPVAGHPVIGRAELKDRVTKLGQQRAAFTICMTCFGTARRWPTWEESPVGAMSREAQVWKTQVPLRNELLAIAELVDRHRDEFDGLLNGLGDTVRLSDRRAERRYRA